jgi:sugar O-acyltransferase (sialic acid O-acetyltransferase NeuD family)
MGDIMKNIVIFGSGGHCKVIIDIIEKMNHYHILGLIDSIKEVGTEVLGYKVLGNIHSIKELSLDIHGGIVAIGDNWNRNKMVTEILSVYKNFHFITAIHPSAVIGKSVMIKEGTVVMANAVINSNSSIGRHCIINTKSSVDHDGMIHDFATIAPGATLAGNVQVGEHSVVSLGANVIHNIKIGEHTVIGAGSTVLRDVPPYTVAYGTPAIEVRKRVAGEKYL